MHPAILYRAEQKALKTTQTNDWENQRPIKVLFLTDKVTFGGTPVQMVELAVNLDRKKFAPHFIALSEVEPEMRERLQKSEIPCEAVGETNWTQLRAVASVRQLRAKIRKIQPDIIHAFLPTSNVLAALVGRVPGVKAVISSHRDLGGFDGKQIVKLNDFADRRWADCVTANSAAVRNAACERTGLDKDQIKIMYNGVNVERILAADRGMAKRKEIGLALDDVVVAMIANIREAKGHIFAIEAFNRIAEKFPHARLLLLGYSADEKLHEKLKQTVARAGNESRVKFLGSRKDALEILHASDVLVAPSLSEGFSNTILEAMAAGKPVAASNVGGNKEQVVDQETGFLTPPSEVDSLADALGKLLASSELRAKMGAAGRERVEAHFTIQKAVERHETLYAQLVD